jgi:hypothetical protein
VDVSLGIEVVKPFAPNASCGRAFDGGVVRATLTGRTAHGLSWIWWCGTETPEGNRFVRERRDVR